MLLLVAVWPASFALFGGYAESLTIPSSYGGELRAKTSGARSVVWFAAGLAGPRASWWPFPFARWHCKPSRGVACALLTPMGLLGYWGWLRWSGRLSVVSAYRLYQGMALAPPWAGAWESVRAPIAQHDALLAIRLGLIILVLALILRREVRIEDKLFALAVILQMVVYAGRPAPGTVRYLLPVYPAFLSLGSYADAHWSGKQFTFYLVAFGFFNLAWMRAFLDWSLVV